MGDAALLAAPQRFHSSYSPKLSKIVGLYQLAKRSQWDAQTDIDWDRPLGFDAGAPEAPQLAQRRDFATHFFIGKQGALATVSQLISMVPDLEAKLFLGTQVLDEARHVEVYAAYARKAGGFSQVNPELEVLMRSLMDAESYEVKIVGLQVLLEGTLLEWFMRTAKHTPCPVLRDVLSQVMKDEARHANFGVAYLTERLRNASPALRDHMGQTILRWARQFVRVVRWENPDLPRVRLEQREQSHAMQNELINIGRARLEHWLGMVGLTLPV